MAVQLLNETNVMALPIDDIKPNPYQQRKYFDFYSLNRLTESIKKYGVIQPVTVRLVNGKTYELVAGERRLRAARAAGLKTIPGCFYRRRRGRKLRYFFYRKSPKKNTELYGGSGRI